MKHLAHTVVQLLPKVNGMCNNIQLYMIVVISWMERRMFLVLRQQTIRFILVRLSMRRIMRGRVRILGSILLGGDQRANLRIGLMGLLGI